MVRALMTEIEISKKEPNVAVLTNAACAEFQPRNYHPVALYSEQVITMGMPVFKRSGRVGRMSIQAQ